MARHLALLRAINVGKANRIKMADLRELCVALGFADPITHIQTGNVFLTTDHAAEVAAGQLEQGLAEQFDVNTVAVMRSEAELAEAISGVPFSTAGDAPKNHHITFLTAAPEPARLAAIDPDKWAPDQFQVVGQHLYLRFVDGAGSSRLNVAWLEKALSVQGTARNLAVSQALLKHFGETSSS